MNSHQTSPLSLVFGLVIYDERMRGDYEVARLERTPPL